MRRVVAVFVFNIGNKTGVAVDVVGNYLTATIGQSHVVSSLGVISVAVFVVTIVYVAVVIPDGVVEVVVGWSLENHHP